MAIPRRLFCLLAGAALSATLLLTGAQTAGATSGVTCSGGPIPGGTYSSLSVTGFCLVVAGNVNVQGNLTVAPGGALNAAFSGSNVKVGGNLIVKTGGILALGCEPKAFACFNDPGGITNDSVAGNLIGDGALMILLHHSTIAGQVTQSAGGGGVNCQPLPFGPPAYTAYEDNVMGGNVIVEGLHTCWSGFFRNTVAGNVNWNDNVTWDGTPEPPGDPAIHGDEDGNEISANTVHGNLNCSDNFPAVQFGDSAGVPNTVAGKVHGQCTAVV
jgi:hypothetical protein